MASADLLRYKPPEFLDRAEQSPGRPLRVLYSFPHKLGAQRICQVAWHQVNELAGNGVQMLVFPGVLHRPLANPALVRPTLSRGRWRVPYKLLGRMNACAWHDFVVARRLQQLSGQVDLIHAWPLGAVRTLKTAARLGIATVLERANSHTRFGYEIVNRESRRLGLRLPPGDEHEFNPTILRKEEEEYRLADGLLCPSSFVIRTFLEQGFAPEKLLQHGYGFDQQKFRPGPREQKRAEGFQVLFVGVGNVVKGLHFALEAWQRSGLQNRATFLIAGPLMRAYAERLGSMLEQPGIKLLGYRSDVPELMRQSDVLVLPSLTEGFPLVVAEAMGSGCVPVVSDACPDICRHMQNSLVHQVGDVEALAGHFALLERDPGLLQKLRTGVLQTVPELTWKAAGEKLLKAYRQVLAHRTELQPEPVLN